MRVANRKLQVGSLELCAVADSLDLEMLLDPFVTPSTMFAIRVRVSP